VPFASYANIGDVARTFRITLLDEEFVAPLERPVSAMLRADLDFADAHVAYANSEFAICENLIYPVLKEVWKSYLDELMLWSHEPLHFDDDLTGVPDYFLARRSPLGRWVRERPYLLVVEAKRDDFVRGWAQCLAALLAAQKLNDMPELTLYGITTNGQVWEFASLTAARWTRDPRPFTLRNLQELCGAVHFAFEQCRKQVVRLPRTA
jgi:hypothetical protein